jgi:hypothetical protein
MTTTADQFRANITEIALDLVEAYKLTYGAPSAAMDELALQRWMDYRLRHIGVRPREVKKSSRFPVQSLPEEVNNALSALEARFTEGQDVNAYLSKTTIKNDVSDAKSQRRTDGLWADWGIHHLHLTTEPLAAGARFSERSDWLLFVRVYEDAVAFIDVRSHDEKDLWTQDELLTTFIDSWPEQSERYRISSMRVTPRPSAAGDLKKLRNAGITTPVEHNGEHYFGFGGGVTSAVTSTAASLACIQVQRNAQHLARSLDLPNNPIRLEFIRRGVPQPQLILAVGDDGLVIAERSRLDLGGVIYPEFDEQGKRTAFGVVHDGLLPKWARSTLTAHIRSKP